MSGSSGRTRWSREIAQASGLALGRGTLYAWTDDGRVISVPSYAGVVASGGDVYFGGGGTLHKFDVTTGRVRRTFEVGNVDKATTTLAVADGVAYLTRSGVRVDAVDTVTGKLRWRYSLSGRPAPVPMGGRVYIGSHNGNVYAAR